MKKEIYFPYPFSGFCALNFNNCFSSIYMYLEQIQGNDDYFCQAHEGKGCNGCGNCNQTLAKKQEDFLFLFGTMAGDTALRNSFEGQTDMQQAIYNTDEQVDFTMKFTGYLYKKVTDDFQKAVIEAINQDKPLLARMKDADRGSFRVISGYDKDAIICPNPSNAQRRPDQMPTYEDIEYLYVITGKAEPEYNLLDGLYRIKRAMEYNRDEKFWDQYIHKFNYWDEHLADVDFEEIKRRFKRVTDTMWYTFNCHNFAETFRHKIWEGMNDERLKHAFDEIDRAYDLTHTRAWQIIGINDCRDWGSRRYNELEWGLCATIMMIIESIKQNDIDVLAAISEAIAVLEIDK
ncbi:MAG: hypothetical protein K0S47_3502 [Herbinix sp.]|jgi:hypothetical protein|nr:hypothetical protein [Herbinix sp.]